LEVKKRLYDRN
jgi:2-phosphoglycerate kinase